MSASQRLDANGGIDESLPVRVINYSDEPVQWMYANVKYQLLPNTPTFVPYYAMCLYRGDPRAVDMPTGRAHEQYRRNEYARLHIFNGIHEGGSRTWDNIPDIKCYPIDSDVPFATVVDDPEGNSLADAKEENSQVALLQSSMEDMAQKMRAMQGQLRVQQEQRDATVAAGFDPDDLESQVTTSKAISPEEATGQSMVGAHPAKKSLVAKKGDAKVTTDGE